MAAPSFWGYELLVCWNQPATKGVVQRATGPVTTSSWDPLVLCPHQGWGTSLPYLHLPEQI